MTSPRLSVICPFYNEKDNLEEFCKRLSTVLNQLPCSWEVIFVNDGSSDSGPEFLRGSTQMPLTLLNLDRNYGLSTAFHAGFQAAQGEIFATLDTDLQNPPEELPRLLEMMEQADMVTGIRVQRQDSLVRRMSSRIANGVRRFFLKDTILDSGCSLRVFRREALKYFYPYQNIHRYFPALVQRAGLKVLQVPVQHHPRTRGQAKYNVGNRLWIGLWDVISVKWVHDRKINYRIKG